MAASILAAFVISRLICSMLVYLGHGQRPYLTPVHGGWEGVDHWWLNPWTTYDSQWYLQIAAQGYQEQTTAFFPLYPWLLRLAGDDPIRMAAFGVGLSLVALLATLWLVFRLTELEWGTAHAHAAVWLLAFSPAAPFFGAVYTESLFLALLAATFLALRRQYWWLAGLLGALAALLRNPGVLIAGALLLESVDARHQERTAGRLYAWLLPLGAFLAVQFVFWRHFGSPLAGVSSQSFYHRQISLPWNPLFGDLKAVLSMERSLLFSLVAGAGLLASIVGLALPLCCWRQFRKSYLLLVGGITLMNLCMMRQLLPHTISAVRYMGGLFPVAQVFAWLIIVKLHDQPRLRLLLIGVQLYLFAVFSYLFGLKQFLG